MVIRQDIFDMKMFITAVALFAWRVGVGARKRGAGICPIKT